MKYFRYYLRYTSVNVWLFQPAGAGSLRVKIIGCICSIEVKTSQFSYCYLGLLKDGGNGFDAPC